MQSNPKQKTERRERKKKKVPKPTLRNKGQGVAHKSLTYLLRAGNQKAPKPTLKQTRGQGVAHRSLTYLLAAGAFHFLAISKILSIAQQSKTKRAFKRFFVPGRKPKSLWLRLEVVSRRLRQKS